MEFNKFRIWRMDSFGAVYRADLEVLEQGQPKLGFHKSFCFPQSGFGGEVPDPALTVCVVRDVEPPPIKLGLLTLDENDCLKTAFMSLYQADILHPQPMAHLHIRETGLDLFIYQSGACTSSRKLTYGKGKPTVDIRRQLTEELAPVELVILSGDANRQNQPMFEINKKMFLFENRRLKERLQMTEGDPEDFPLALYGAFLRAWDHHQDPQATPRLCPGILSRIGGTSPPRYRFSTVEVKPEVAEIAQEETKPEPVEAGEIVPSDNSCEGPSPSLLVAKAWLRGAAIGSLAGLMVTAGSWIAMGMLLQRAVSDNQIERNRIWVPIRARMNGLHYKQQRVTNRIGLLSRVRDTQDVRTDAIPDLLERTQSLPVIELSQDGGTLRLRLGPADGARIKLFVEALRGSEMWKDVSTNAVGNETMVTATLIAETGVNDLTTQPLPPTTK